MQEFQFIRDGKPEIVYAERWGWAAAFNDGTEMKQFGDDAIFHQVGEIDQSRLTLFCLYNISHPEKFIDIPWKVGMKIVHGYKKFMENGRVLHERTIYKFGYKSAGRYFLSFILPDDRIVLTDDPNMIF